MVPTRCHIFFITLWTAGSLSIGAIEMTTHGSDVLTAGELDTAVSYSPTVMNSSSVSEVAHSSGTTHACRAYKFTMGVLITGLVGNVLALVVLFRYETSGQRTSTPALLGALALSDIVGVCLLFIMKVTPTFCVVFQGSCGHFMSRVFPYCEVYGWLFLELVHSTSSWFIVVVALHRYIAVCRPHQASAVCTRQAAAKHLAAALVCCVLFQLPRYFEFYVNIEQHEDGSMRVSRDYTAMGRNRMYQILYKTTLFFTLIYAFPFVILIFCTFFLIRALRRSHRMHEAMNRSNATTTQTSRKDSKSKILIALVVIYLICQPWEPVRKILEGIYGFQGCGPGNVYYYYEEFPSLFFAVNSACNFFIYCLMSSKFRSVFMNTFRCYCRDSGRVEMIRPLRFEKGACSSDV